MSALGKRESDSHQAISGEQLDDCGVPLFVDLDGTLVKSDLLIESFFLLVKSQPTAFLSAFTWLLRGKAYLKSKIAEQVDISPQALPYQTEFLAFLRSEAARGRALYLATASNEKFARSIAQHLGIFRGVLGSTSQVNMKGWRKLEEIHKLSEGQRFDYAGDSRADLEIWRHARKAILVNPESGLEAAARGFASIGRIFDDRPDRLRSYSHAIRIHQWPKNMLIFVPLLTAHAWHSAAIINALVGFLAFSLTASATYVLNDLLDLQSDRNHPRKRTRPFAAGTIPPVRGLALMFLLLAAGLGLGWFLPPLFEATLLAYLGITFLYSLHLKGYVLIDVIVLAGLYTLRLISGAVAIGVVLSFWLLAFSMFIFLSLALVKRCSELITMSHMGRPGASGRDYQIPDLAYLSAMGTASGYASILVLALFINSPDVAVRYSEPLVLWLLCPLFLYWISRLWIKTGRGEMHDDPVVFTVKDRGSRYVMAGVLSIVLLAL
jgi:4-hydroxybenzoate polyprenyltransferase/phosphoserine phosphatase